MQNNESRHDRLIGIDEVLDRVSLSKVTIWRLRKRHEFPEPVMASPGRRLWSEQLVNQWIESKLPKAPAHAA
jgi:predicted DNA-binding transcriptional regulator AlpA